MLISSMYQEVVYDDSYWYFCEKSVHFSLVNLRRGTYAKWKSCESVKPLHASNVENICVPVSLFATCSTVAISRGGLWGLFSALLRSRGSMHNLMLSLVGGFFFSLPFRLLITNIEETQGVCSYSFTIIPSSFTIIPSSSISLSFCRAGSNMETGIFLGGCTTGVTAESTSKCTLLGNIPGLLLKQLR